MRTNTVLPFLMVFVLLALFAAGPAQATASAPRVPAQAGDFGSGISVCQGLQPVVLNNPTTITSCTRQGIQTALDQGGHIRFDCGSDPVTIPIDATLQFNPRVSTVLDGGGLVTLDGQGQVRLFFKDWHDPALGEISITLQNIRLINGKAPSGGDTGDHSGGAIAVGHPGTRLHIINATFENNSTREVTAEDNQGGAIFVHNSYETVLSGSVFRDNSAGSGGAFGGIATGLEVDNSLFVANHAVDNTQGGIVRGYGGAIALDGVSNGYNPNSSNQLRVCGSTFQENVAVRGGGAIDAVISDNLGTKAIYTRSTFIGNRADGVPGAGGGEMGQGGAIYHIEDDHAGGRGEDNLEISYSTFHGNQALRQGGALWLYILGHGEIVNTTIEGNSTSAPYNTVGQGGGAAINLGVIDITNTVFANNHAAYQGGALMAGGDDPDRVITLSNTIFYNNTLNEQDLPSETRWQGYHTNRPMADGGQNIQYPRYKPTYNNDVNNNITANPIYADPLLMPLVDNGGWNQTMALQTGSPAIDSGVPATCPGDDQRGYPRSGLCDIGPYELGAAPFEPSIYLWLPLVSR